jgi:hypothetical protein
MEQNKLRRLGEYRVLAVQFDVLEEVLDNRHGDDEAHVLGVHKALESHANDLFTQLIVNS